MLSGYEFEPVPPFKMEDYAGLTPDAILKKGLRVVRTKGWTHSVAIDAASIKVDQPIPKEKFTIDLPAACFVRDEFLGTHYHVSEGDEASS